MKTHTGKAIAFFLIAASFVGLSTGCEEKPVGGSNTSTPPAPPGNTIKIEYEIRPSILIEAESGKVHAPMALVEDPLASEGEYVLAPEGPEHEEINEGGDVTCTFDVKEPGEYFLWARCNWCCGCANSLGVVLNGADLLTLEDAVFKEWHWILLRDKEPRRLKLAAGNHVLMLTNREDGAAVDQILLTQDPEYRPGDIEKPDAPGRTVSPARKPDAPPAPPAGSP